MLPVKTALAASLLAAGAALSIVPSASAAPAPAPKAPAANCQLLRHGVWWCNARNPLPVFRDNAQITDTPLRYISGGGFETNCMNDGGNYSGRGSHPNRWEYTTYGGAGGWVADSMVRDETNPIQACP